MRQFDVYRNPSRRSGFYAPMVVVLQSHLLEAMPTAVAAPMLTAEGRKPYGEIAAEVRFNGVDYIVSVGELAAVDIRQLKTVVGSLHQYEDVIRRALDRLFTGF